MTLHTRATYLRVQQSWERQKCTRTPHSDTHRRDKRTKSTCTFFMETKRCTPTQRGHRREHSCPAPATPPGASRGSFTAGASALPPKPLLAPLQPRNCLWSCCCCCWAATANGRKDAEKRKPNCRCCPLRRLNRRYRRRPGCRRPPCCSCRRHRRHGCHDSRRSHSEACGEAEQRGEKRDANGRRTREKEEMGTKQGLDAGWWWEQRRGSGRRRGGLQQHSRAGIRTSIPGIGPDRGPEVR